MAVHGHSIALTIKDPIEQELLLHPHVHNLDLHSLNNERRDPHQFSHTLPSYDNLVNSLLTCRSSKCLVSAHRMHLSICSNGLESYGCIGNHVVPMFVDCGSIIDAHQAFNRKLL
ncbi:hypothetical protein GOP47_0017110, partial [Adiantum capillus-veneris]